MTQARNVALNGSQINSSGVMLTPGGGTNTATPGAVGNILTSDGTNWVSQAPAASGVTSFNTRTGAVTLASGDVTGALGYTPPQPNGTGASGTWGINISGNAATASNGGVTSVNGATGAVSLSGAFGANGQYFTTSGTFTVPAGVTTVKVSCVGGGAGGGNAFGGSPHYGGNGGTSSFGSYISCTGGTGSGGPSNTGDGGTVTGADFTASTGYAANTSGGAPGCPAGLGNGGVCSIPMGGISIWGYAGTAGTTASGYGMGGGTSNSSGGGGGGYGIKYVTGLTPGGTVAVTVGGGGGGNNTGAGDKNGTAGIVLVEW